MKFKLFKMKPKFKVGDIVRHAATTKANGRRMVITFVYINQSDDSDIFYCMSGEKDLFDGKADAFFNTMLREKELMLVDL